MTDSTELSAANRPGRGSGRVRLAVFHCNSGRLVRPRPLDISSVAEVYLPCTGRVDLASVLKCLEQEISKVLLVGCGEADCRFPHPSGGCQAKDCACRAKRVLKVAGLGSSRIDFMALDVGQSLEQVVKEALAELDELRGAGDRDGEESLDGTNQTQGDADES